MLPLSPVKKPRHDGPPVETPVETPDRTSNPRKTFPFSPSSPSSPSSPYSPLSRPVSTRSAPTKPKRKSTENEDSEDRWYKLLFQIKNNADMPVEMKIFIEKLDSGKTTELLRERGKDFNHIFIDKEDVTPRLVYKFIPVKQYNNEIRTYEALEAKYKDDEVKHYLELVFFELFKDYGYGVLVTEYMDGLEPGNLLLVNDGDTTSKDAILKADAEKYLLDAGITHEDIDGNLYSVDGKFLWIDFEDVKFIGDKGSSSSSSRGQGLFGLGGKGKSRRKIRRRKSHGRKSRRKARAKK